MGPRPRVVEAGRRDRRDASVARGRLRRAREPARAVAAAASPALRDAGVVVALAGTLEAADDVTKLHTTAFDTFRSPERRVAGRGSARAGVVQAGGARAAAPRSGAAPADGAASHLVDGRHRVRTAR